MTGTSAQKERLVAAMEAVTPLSAPIRHAFLSVDRGIFVSRYYYREGSVLDWTLIDTGEAAYDDEALVTKIDTVSKHPASSSSQPSLMAAQLEALDVQPGQRVLEIGTGTGYNAALLADLVGETGHVVSIDIDSDLVHAATQALAIAGYTSVQVVCGDGLQSYSPAAPYDRLLATGSFRTFPSSWLDQLTTGGKLVGNLVGNLASVFVLLQKEQQGSHGVLLPIGGEKRYMELHHGAFPQPATAWEQGEDAPLKEHVIPFDFSTVSENTDFLFFLQCLFPQLERRWHYHQEAKRVERSFVAGRSSVTILPRASQEWVVQARGNENLWESLSVAYQLWEHYGCPSVDQYRISVDLSGQYIALGEMRWKLDQ